MRKSFYQKEVLNDPEFKGEVHDRSIFIEADLRNANLMGMSFRFCTFLRADLRGANLRRACLEGADLQSADLRGSNLDSADIRGTNFAYSDLRGTTLPDYSILPSEGSFIGFKKCHAGVVLKLEILGRRLNSLGSRKCRTNKVRVISACRMYPSEDFKEDFDFEVMSMFHPRFRYFPGAVVTSEIDDDIRVECTKGIHFFLTEKEAREY